MLFKINTKCMACRYCSLTSIIIKKNDERKIENQCALKFNNAFKAGKIMFMDDNNLYNCKYFSRK